jgi:hypothetical protein
MLHDSGTSELLAISDFAAAFGFCAGTRFLSGMIRHCPDENTQTVLLRKQALENRVLVLDLLAAERWGFAWAAAVVAIETEPPGKSAAMLRLNQCFAKKKLGIAVGAEVRAIEVEEPRHQLYRTVLLGQMPEQKTKRLLQSLLDSGNMTLDELESWPGLEDLRARDWWPDWFSERSGRLD